MSGPSDVPGGAHLFLVDGVAHLDPERSVFEAMLEGWTTQQRARFLDWHGTIKPRLNVIRRFADFSNQYPWQWCPGEGEAFLSHLASGPHPIAFSTARVYTLALRLFCQYVTDPMYSWPQVCELQFGAVPRQIWHALNSVAHVGDYEGKPTRRPLDYDEVQALFDAADGRVDDIRARGRKGALAAQRDAIMLKTVYAFGLRRREAWGLDQRDFRRASNRPQYGRYGGVFVRWGKASRGGVPKRRTVLTVPEMDWIVPLLEHWEQDLRPQFCPGQLAAYWVTERRGRLSPRQINTAFETARDLAGIDPELELHGLRHSYVTHCIEFGYPEKFVQDQVGHATASATAIYTGVSDAFRDCLVERALRRRPGLWEEKLT